MKHPEQDLQVSVVEFIKRAAPDLLLFAVPNATGVKGGARLGKINKDMGTRAGVADLCFVLPNPYISNVANVAFIELKAPGTGHRPSSQDDNQRTFAEQCKRVGAPYVICDSLEQVEGTLLGWGVKLRARVSA